jgi:hypothetical protein
MNKDFEFRQLLRAFRGGIISEATFAQGRAGAWGGEQWQRGTP